MKLIYVRQDGPIEYHYYASGHYRVRITVEHETDIREDGGNSYKIEVCNVHAGCDWIDLGYMYPKDIKGRKTKKAYVQRALELAIQFIDGE